MASHIVSEDQSASLLNKEYNEDHVFPQFVLLPWELRNQVWKYALQKRRMIRVSLKERQPDDITEQESRDIKYGRCSLFINGSQLFGKLLRVNSEARKAALEFYRVQLPCVLTHPGSNDTRVRIGMFSFNPEYDILWFEEVYHLPDFFSAIIMHDSRRIGLCNIATSLANIRGILEADDPNKYKCPAFTQTIRNIREFYLVAQTNSYHLELVKEQYNDRDPHDETPITQSLSPLMSNIPTFDLLHRDPRSIEHDLSRLFLGFDDIPREITSWNLMLDEWGADPSQMESRVLFICRDMNPCLPVEDSSHEGPELQRSRVPRTNRLLYEPSSSLVPTIHLTAERQAAKREDSPAFGFWMFPLDAFSEANKSRHSLQSPNIWDLSNYWPELGLFHLPTGPSRNEGEKVGI
ncbi:hypothetical protein E0Z10_g7324 [Xylaria hypoxylon]|uniref:2EXR domain-containing protein n=1 Tax=Xylaria hypoxylon TaxID=37992 RepID=A0A4Z0YYK6_9PEZI|nr:hypothetical protein E0Z10_g7324 [Xylaria hypoxylon]